MLETKSGSTFYSANHRAHHFWPMTRVLSYVSDNRETRKSYDPND